MSSVLPITVPLAIMTTVSSSTALVSFAIYLVAVFGLAWLAGRHRSEGGFISEYFLGSRNLGVWAFALTFAATSASGGSFVGFPALIYTHGWVLALWIAGYMVVPIVAMGLLGKRLNHVSRVADAVTVPDVIERRFRSPLAGIIATLLIVSFMFYFLLAQFKAGSEILAILLRGVPAFDAAVATVASTTSGWRVFAGTDPDYVLCLGVFSVAVIVYVVYGGFRAVVWTDVMQGLIMFGGVAVLLLFALRFTGGLESATQQLAQRVPPQFGTAVLVRASTSSDPGSAITKGTWLGGPEGAVLRVTERIDVTANAERVEDAPVMQLISPADIAAVPPEILDSTWSATAVSVEPYVFGATQAHSYVYPPGPHRTNPLGFLSIGMAFGYFVFWPFGAAGQPSNMVRLMAFRDTPTLKWSIATVTIYFSFIYFSLVIIFCCARVLMPGMEMEADRVMPELAVQSTNRAGVPWLAGFLLAAPFAAVMSSVDSFLLLVSSSIVRDVYQRYIHPAADERLLKRVTYIGTVIVGLLATYGALRPPAYLQAIIVDASGFLAASFLVPVALSLYWRRMTPTGAVAGMVAGCTMHAMFSFKVGETVPALSFITLLPWGPLVWDLAASLLGVLAGSWLTKPMDETFVDRYFH
jgi:Na+/pantothenate symporter